MRYTFVKQDVSADLGLPKKYTGYSFLLDKDSRIRWRGSGIAEPEEVESMLNCAQQLLDPLSPGNK